MINHDRKFVFIHIPRCGGNFINDFFDPDWIEKMRSKKKELSVNYFIDFFKNL